MTIRKAVLCCAVAVAAMATWGERAVTPEALETLKHSLIHRGDGKGRPDNTMEALLYTWSKGYTPESGTDYPEALYQAVEVLRSRISQPTAITNN